MSEHARAIEEVIKACSWGIECRSNDVGHLPYWHVFTVTPYEPEFQVQLMSEDACLVLDQAINEWGWSEVASPLVQSQVFYALLLEREYHIPPRVEGLLDYSALEQ